jgi:hypothetical protein
MSTKPFRLDQQLPIVRAADGKFREMPTELGAQPNDYEQAKQPPGTWHPGVGQGLAPSGSPTMAFGPVPPPRSGVPFRLKP